MIKQFNAKSLGKNKKRLELGSTSTISIVSGKVEEWRSSGSSSHDWMSLWARGSSESPAPVGLPLMGPQVFSSTTTSHPAKISVRAHDTPAILPPTTTALGFISLSLSLSLSLSVEERNICMAWWSGKGKGYTLFICGHTESEGVQTQKTTLT